MRFEVKTGQAPTISTACLILPVYSAGRHVGIDEAASTANWAA